MVQELVRWWEAVHYTVLRRRCAEAGMHDLAAMQATSLLRYIGAIPADKAFYEAGAAFMLHSCCIHDISTQRQATNTDKTAQKPHSIFGVCLHAA